MSEYTCHVCGESFESDWHRTPKYCPSCKEMPSSGKAVVYGVHSGDGKIWYIGSTTDPIHRLFDHRQKYGSVQMKVLCIVPADERRKHEEIEIRKQQVLLNERAAKPKIYTKEEAHAILAKRIR